MNKKKVFVIALAVCLLAILSFSTLAWFSDSDTVTNKFHVATSADPADPDDIFSVDVQEKVDTDGDGVADQVIAKGDDTNGQTYENIYPSQVLVKEPLVKNTGAYGQYIRMNVTVDESFDAMAGDLNTCLQGYDANLWSFAGKRTENGKVTYVYYLNKVLEKDQSETLFTHVVIPAQLDQEDMATLNGGFTMEIVAEAVQSDNTGDNAVDAFALVNP